MSIFRCLLPAILFCLFAENAHAGGWDETCTYVVPTVTTPDGSVSEPGFLDCQAEETPETTPYDPYSSGGSGGSSSGESFPDVDIPTQLKCSLDKYLHSDIKLTGGRTMKKVNGWAFGKQNSYGVWGYAIKSTNISPGAGWTPVAGIAPPGTAYGRLYNRAFQSSTDFPRTGSRPDAPSNSLSGAISAFEMSLFTSAHEASHLLGNSNNEDEADWYGINAVLKYRSDGGAKCPN